MTQGLGRLTGLSSVGFPQNQGHGCTSCQAPELLPRPEEVRVWLLLPQFHPVAVTIEILGAGEQKATVITISSPYPHSFESPHLESVLLTSAMPRLLSDAPSSLHTLCLLPRRELSSSESLPVFAPISLRAQRPDLWPLCSLGPQWPPAAPTGSAASSQLGH